MFRVNYVGHCREDDLPGLRIIQLRTLVILLPMEHNSSCSNSARQKQAQSAAQVITPAPAVRPRRECAQQHKIEYNQQNSSKPNISFNMRMWFAWLTSVIPIVLVVSVVLLILFLGLIRAGRLPVFRILLNHHGVVICRRVVKIHLH